MRRLDFLHFLGDLAAQPDHLHLFDAVAQGGGRGAALAAGENGVEIGVGDAPFGAAAGHRVQARCRARARAGARPARPAAFPRRRGDRRRRQASPRSVCFAAGAVSAARGAGGCVAATLPAPSTSSSTSGAPTAAFSPSCAVQRDDLAGHGRGHLHRRLVGHHVDQVLLLLDRSPTLTCQATISASVGAFADVGELEDIAAHVQPSRTRRMAAATRAGPMKYSHSKPCG